MKSSQEYCTWPMHRVSITNALPSINWPAISVILREERQPGIIGAPFEVDLTETSLPVQPDVLFLSNAQKPEPGTQKFTGAPTLIVEVISPSSIRLDRQTKFDAYEQAGVAEYWLVDPKRTRN